MSTTKVDKRVGAEVVRLEQERFARLIATRRFVFCVSEDWYYPQHGYRVSICVEGEHGHFPTGDDRAIDGDYSNGAKLPWFWGPTFEDAQRICNDQNAALGYSPEEAALIVATTIP